MRTSVADKKFTRLNTNFLTKNLPYSLKGNFQMQALRRCGHCVTSNAPEKVSKVKKLICRPSDSYLKRKKNKQTQNSAPRTEYTRRIFAFTRAFRRNVFCVRICLSFYAIIGLSCNF